MKRAPSEDLFRLIKSLSKGEKRNFKLLAGLLASDKDKRYIELFDVIDRQDVYNEGKVSKVMKDLYGGQLAVGKHYLYRLILRSLVYFRSTPGADLNSLMEQVKVLLEKEMYPQAAKMLRKGVQEAEEIEDFPSLHTLLCQQVAIALRTLSDKALLTRLEELEESKRLTLLRIENLNAFNRLGYRAFALQQTRTVASGAVDEAELAALREEELLTDPGKAMSTRATLEYLAIWRKVESLSANLPAAIQCSEQLLALYDEHPALKEELIRDYFNELATLCTYLLRQGLHEKAFELMDQFRSYRDQYPKARIDFFQLYYVMQVAAAIHVGEPERALAIVPEIESEWQSSEGRVPKAHEMLLKYLIAYAYFMEGRHSEALRWINRLLSGPKLLVRLDVQSNARLLNLLIHFELGNHMLVESEALSTRRFLDKHSHLNDFEKLALRCIKAMSSAAGLPNEQSVQEAWLARLREYEGRTGENHGQMLDLFGWISTRGTKQTLSMFRRSSLKEGVVRQFAY